MTKTEGVLGCALSSVTQKPVRVVSLLRVVSTLSDGQAVEVDGRAGVIQPFADGATGHAAGRP